MRGGMLIAWLNAATPETFIGEKARTLAALATHGINVPKGFVITQEAFTHFLAANQIDLQFLENLNLEDQEQVAHAAAELQHLFQQAYFPETLQQEILSAYDQMLVSAEVYHHVSAEALNILKTGRDLPKVLIRSSWKEGKALFHIKGKEALLQAIKESWMLRFQPALLQHHMHDMEVIVQKMLTVERSGVVVPDQQTHIEVVLGLYDAVTQQLVQPDVYALDEQGTFITKQVVKQEFLFVRDSQGSLIKKHLFYHGESQKLSDYDARQIAKLYQKITSILGYMSILEFAFDGNQLYVLQATQQKQEPVVEHVMQQAQPDMQAQEPETLSSEDLHTVTELKVFLEQKDSSIPCDGVFTTASLQDLQEIAKEYQQNTVWYALRDAQDLLDIAKFHDAGANNVGIAICGLTEIEQLRMVKNSLKKAGLEPLEEIEVGLVIDSPLLLYLLDDIDREGIDFLVVDFATLAERSAGKVTDGKNKGYLKLLHHLVKECKLRNIEIGVAGTFDDELIDFFVKAGFDSLILPKAQLENVKKTVARAEKRLLLNAARRDLKEI